MHRRFKCGVQVNGLRLVHACVWVERVGYLARLVRRRFRCFRPFQALRVVTRDARGNDAVPQRVCLEGRRRLVFLAGVRRVTYLFRHVVFAQRASNIRAVVRREGSFAFRSPYLIFDGVPVGCVGLGPKWGLSLSFRFFR